MGAKPVILNAEPDGYAEEASAILRPVAELRTRALSPAELPAALADVNGLIVRLGHRVDASLLAAAPNLRLVATATTGLNHIDTEAAGRRGIAVLSLKGETAFLNTVTATAEHTWGLLLALIRHLPAACAHAASGAWDRDLFQGRELSALTLGIVGYGRLGRMVAGYAHAFRMRVLASDPTPIARDANVAYMPLEELLQQADVITLHVPLAPQTKLLLGAAQFATMRPGAFLINTSRGEIVDESALLSSLRAGRLAGAAVDVLTDEPRSGSAWPARHPLLAYAREHNNLLVTPHIGGNTSDSKQHTEVFLARKIRRFLTAGE